MLKEFKDFAMRGNVVDMAVGIIIGAAFGGIVKSLVSDVLMPPIFFLVRGINRLKRQEAAPPAEPTTKECPLCLSTVPIQAVRCAHCTGEMKAA
ncbi:MAG TPA: hypothetical protein DD658_10275 [Deltaproteobacteria bacterium]|nr:MAG: hypothetical protein A2X88_06700 [Deltaproteobacteria bacterium GWC2_65_14]HBO70468.1 hypothetical protein [Deltaproteobacteria bacterium]